MTTATPANDRTGLAGLGVSAVVCAVVAIATWLPLAFAFSAATRAVPSGVLLVPITIGVVLFALRRPTGVAIGALTRRLGGARFLVGPVFATVVFVLIWAGAHGGLEGELGIVPQILFPALVGSSAYAFVRWSARLQRTLRPLFGWRDARGLPTRVGIALVGPLALSLLLARTLESAAWAQQVVVLAGLALGYAMFVPRVEKTLGDEHRVTG